MNPDRQNTSVVNDEVEELLRVAEDTDLLKFNVNSHTIHASSSMNPMKKNTSVVNDEVEELLMAAQDATLLKLNVNSHSVHASPSDLHPELEQRFQDLKSGSKSKARKDSMTQKVPPPESAKVNEEVEEDELLARFAALKASLPKPSPSVASSFVGVDADGSSVSNFVFEEEDEDEVEKVIRWAKDAARLDPSPSSDEEESTKGDVSDDNEMSDEDAEGSETKPKGQRK